MSGFVGGIIIVDEPTNGIARATKDQYITMIINPNPNTQTFASTHDDGLITRAENDINWRVIELTRKST